MDADLVEGEGRRSENPHGPHKPTRDRGSRSPRRRRSFTTWPDLRRVRRTSDRSTDRGSTSRVGSAIRLGVRRPPLVSGPISGRSRTERRSSRARANRLPSATYADRGQGDVASSKVGIQTRCEERWRLMSSCISRIGECFCVLSSGRADGVARTRFGAVRRPSERRGIDPVWARAVPISGDVSRFGQPDSDQRTIPPILHRPGRGAPRWPATSPARSFQLLGGLVQSRSSCRRPSPRASCQVSGFVCPRARCFGTHPVRHPLPIRIDSRRAASLIRGGASS